MLTRKHFVMISDILRENRTDYAAYDDSAPEVWSKIVADFSYALSRENPRFNEQQFLEACLAPQEDS
jgi:hypothetical protein